MLERTVAITALAIDRLHQAGSWLEYNQRLQAALKVNEIGTWFWDCKARRLRSDANAGNLLGISVPDPDWDTILRKILPDDRAHVEETISTAMQTASSFRVCFRHCEDAPRTVPVMGASAKTLKPASRSRQRPATRRKCGYGANCL